jgi:peptidyl-prolyl cis-trans isomerase SurA
MKRFVIITLALFTANLSNAQKKGKDTTLFTYGTKKVTLKEFEHGFSKNEKPGTKHTAKDVDDYLELYKKFKLKVQDAYDQGIDTTDGFKSELATYRKQIAKPYLTDKIVNDQLVKEAYERYGYEVRTSHILIRVTPDAAPADTLKALAKLNELRNDIVSGKLDFANAAETFSEDPSAKDNRGDLGFATAFQLVYEYENQAYNTTVGQVSKVFRTPFGYHILKVVDRRPTKGDMTVKHIMIQTNPNPGADEVAEAKAKIDEVYKKLQAGEKFDQLVQQYSEDVSSATNNGELPPFSMTSMLLPEQF